MVDLDELERWVTHEQQGFYESGGGGPWRSANLVAKREREYFATLRAAAPDLIAELRATRRVVEAAQFAVDYADDDGSCVVCNYPLAASKPGDLFCDDDCPGHELRAAVVECNAVIGTKNGSSHDDV